MREVVVRVPPISVEDVLDRLAADDPRGTVRVTAQATVRLAPGL